MKEESPASRGRTGQFSSLQQRNATQPGRLQPPTASGKISNANLDVLRTQLVAYLERTGTGLQKCGTRYNGLCPGHDDHTPSFSVFGSDLSVCGCYPCDFTGDVFAVAQWLGRASTFLEAVRHVAEVLGCLAPQGEVVANYVRPQPKPKTTPTPVVFDADTIHRGRLEWENRFWANDLEASAAMESLGLPREALRWASWGSSGLGWDKGWLCYAYPTGLKWRNPDPNGRPRFRWLTGKAVEPWRAEWIKPNTRVVYITEGESDCLALIAAGLEDAGDKACVAIPSAPGFTREWAPLFRGKRVILCFDEGEAGSLATANAAAALKGHAAEILRWKGPRLNE